MTSVKNLKPNQNQTKLRAQLELFSKKCYECRAPTKAQFIFAKN